MCVRKAAYCLYNFLFIMKRRSEVGVVIMVIASVLLGNRECQYKENNEAKSPVQSNDEL